LNFDEYIALLLSAATACDKEFQPKNSKHLIYLHGFEDTYDHADLYEDYDGYDIDASVHEI
jgi:hypothetical protein